MRIVLSISQFNVGRAGHQANKLSQAGIRVVVGLHRSFGCCQHAGQIKSIREISIFVNPVISSCHIRLRPEPIVIFAGRARAR